MNILLKLPFEAFRAFALTCYRLAGWRVEGELPDEKKFVVIAAPHTSNWDFIFMLCCAVHWRVRLHWLGKDGLFKPPFGWFMRALGGIPVDRSKSNNVVAQMVDVFHDSSKTRRRHPTGRNEGKCSPLENRILQHCSRGGRADCAWISGLQEKSRRYWHDAVADPATMRKTLKQIKAFYGGVTPKFPERIN